MAPNNEPEEANRAFLPDAPQRWNATDVFARLPATENAVRTEDGEQTDSRTADDSRKAQENAHLLATPAQSIDPDLATRQPTDLTGIFRKITAEPASLPGAPAMPRPQQPSSTATSSLGFTEMFQSFSNRADNASARPADWPGTEAALPGPQPWSQGAASEALRQQPDTPFPPENTLTPQSLDLETEQARPDSGGFTQLLRTLSAEHDESFTPPHPVGAFPHAPDPHVGTESGQGEFTRIIAGSLLREAAAQRIQPSQAAPHPIPETALSQPAQQPAVVPVLSPQPAPHIPVAPAMQQAMHAGHIFPGAIPTAPSTPQPPAMPMSQPAIPPMTAVNRIQAYLPLLLVANAFLMLLVVLLLTAVLLRH